MTYILWSSDFLSSRQFDVWTSLFGIMNQINATFDLKIIVCRCDLYFMVQWCMNIILQDYWSVWSDIFDIKVNVSHCGLYFMGQWFCIISWRPFDSCISYFGIMNQYDPRFDLEINIGHCDLYFKVQWFCLVSWRLIDVWTSLFGIMNQYDPTFDLKINVGHCALYFMVKWFCHILKTNRCMNIIIWDY